jgi:hypothetical protein
MTGASVRSASSHDRVVPITVEWIRHETDVRHLSVGDLDLVGIASAVEDAADSQTCRGTPVRNQLDDRLVGQQRLTSPVLGDEREEPMLDLVPLARSRREMGDQNAKARLVGQLLQLPFPQAYSAAVASTAVSDNQKRGRTRVGPRAHLRPPASNGVDGEGGRIMVDTDSHPGLVQTKVIDTVGDRLALGRIKTVVDANRLEQATRTPLPSGVLELPHEFLLLGVQRDSRLPTFKLLCHPVVDEPELRVAVWMLSPFHLLAIRLQAVPQIVEDLPDQPVAGGVASYRQLLGQHARALARPPQGRFGIAATHGLHQLFQRNLQPRIGARRELAPSARPTKHGRAQPALRC